MKKKYIESGKIVGTHGINGMVRIEPWCDSAEFLCGFKNLYIIKKDDPEKVEIESSKPHGNIVIAKLKGVNSIEEADKFRGRIVNISRCDLNLEDGRYLVCELIGCTVYDEKTEKILGKISKVSQTGANDVWHIKNADNEYLVPCIKDIVKLVDIDNDKIVIKPIDGIFE